MGAIERITKCDLVIPHKQWALNLTPHLERIPGLGGVVRRFAQEEFENLKAIEIWARRFRQECVSSGCAPAKMLGVAQAEYLFDSVSPQFSTEITLEEAASLHVTITATDWYAIVWKPMVNSIQYNGPGAFASTLTYIVDLDAGTHDIGAYSSSAAGSESVPIYAAFSIVVGCSGISNLTNPAT